MLLCKSRWGTKYFYIAVWLLVDEQFLQLMEGKNSLGLKSFQINKYRGVQDGNT
ncbi:MAG: hypothetical protein ACI8PB_000215 [Desulforhopalus sp.]|jgi:hypothetical protein